LRHRITIEIVSRSQNEIGEWYDSWSTWATVWGSIEPNSGKRYFEAMQANSEVQGTIIIRYRTGVVGKSLNSKGMEQNFLKKAQEIASDAERRAPVLTGLLKSSMVARLMDKRGNNPRVAVAAVDRKKAPHAHLVEFGTSRAPAHPYFRPAVESKMGSMAKSLKEDLKKGVESSV